MKRIVDLVLAGSAVVVLSPLFAVLAALVRWRMGHPIFFTQRRAGRGGRPFEILKFRTMTDGCDEAGRPLPDADRLTSFGRWLRRTSLDELPELVNVLKGEMSLVGPRPLPVEYLDRYAEHELMRHDVRPGLTGWAQVNGRNQVGWTERLEADVWYVENRSVLLDLRILVATAREVLTGRGVSAPGQATMEVLPPAELRMRS